MATRTLASRIIVTGRRGARPAVVQQRKVIVTNLSWRCYQHSPIQGKAEAQKSRNPSEGDPIADSMKYSAAPSGDNSSAVSRGETEDATGNKNAALLVPWRGRNLTQLTSIHSLGEADR